MEFNNLLTAKLAGSENTEVVVSNVKIPPNTQLPMHWHPGEEFAYIIEGSVILVQEGPGEKVFKKGDACVVPLKQVHTTKTTDEGVEILVFRVHEEGQPERILVD